MRQWVLVLAVVAACGEREAARSDEGAAQDPAIPEATGEAASAGARPAAWRLTPEPLVRIGAAEGEESQLLYGATSAARAGDGRIVVANRGTNEIRWYDADGRFLRSAGGRGGGPGEFQWLSWIMLLPGDSVLAYDAGPRRISIFSPSGEFVRLVPLEPPGERLAELVGRFADGTLLIRRGRRSGFGPGTTTHAYQDTALYLHTEESGTVLDTIGRYPRAEMVVLVDGGRMSFAVPPFAPRPTVRVHGDRIYVALARSYQIEVLDPGGQRVGLVRLDRPNRPVTRDAIARYEAEARAALEREEDRPALERRLAAMPHPETMPAYARILVDTERHLWAEAFRAPGEEVPEWTIFDPDGRRVARLELPAGLRLLQAGADFVLAQRVDALGVERIEVYGLDRDMNT